MNTATADQLQAAESEVRRGIKTTGALIGGDFVVDDEFAQAVIRRLAPSNRPDRICPHSALGPRPLFITAAAPGVALCAACHSHPLEVARRERHATETRDCDACRRDVDGFYEALLAVGPYVLSGHVCRECRDAAR